ncbi:hypothetical protein L1S32_09805 [Methanogenium sp. S4BF]|uniref:hypothetical protein n=1 Tax=Methanogenium sp. S4BF TaxID=1789226 RepID=UPI002416B719|nr:hypothetical protein [Methanogenium sp. S4BF]WFN34135.1 hypothetical protein L1S32_09805 [Methanogenium sp. S4BF]
MALLPLWSFSRYFRCLPLLLSVLFLFSVLCTGPVSAETSGVDLSGMSAVYAIGDEITLRGDTNLAPGTIFLITVEEAGFRPIEKTDAGAFSGLSGTGVVQAGSPPFWSFSFGTAGWAAGEYRFTVEVPKTGTMQSGTFSLLAVEDMPDTPSLTSPVPSPADTPGPSPSPGAPTQSPTAVPLSPVVGVAGIAAIYLFRAYFLD